MMTLDATEFIRRFLLHVLPPGFHRIRYYGLLGHRHRVEHLARCRTLLGTTAPPPIPDETCRPRDYRDRYETMTGRSLRDCPRCHTGQMVVVEHLAGGPNGLRGLDTSGGLSADPLHAPAPVGARGTRVSRTAWPRPPDRS
jgi:hypothetical protein